MWKKVVIFVLAFANLCPVSLAQAANGGDILVTTQSGVYKGRQFSLENMPINGFFGVRYAEAPVGSLRWRRPVPRGMVNDIQDAVLSGPMCPQLNAVGNFTGDEDCLFLDIVIGGQRQKKLKPVLVYLNNQDHFRTGSSQTGALLAKRENLAVVLVNSRLGALGYLYDGPGTGNMGLWDNLVALRWIQSNIESFGGDPTRVTIMGLDSGATLAQLLAASPLSDGLFHRVIAMSPLNIHFPQSYTPAYDRELLKSLAGCNSDSIVICDVSNVGAEEIVRNMVNSRPNLDDEELYPNGLDLERLYQYDYLSGVTSAEENFMTNKLIHARTNGSDGVVTQEVMDGIVESMCQNAFRDQLAAQCLCVNAIRTRFQVDRYAPYSHYRVEPLISALYHSDVIRMILEHGQHVNGSTYAYTIDIKESSRLLNLPEEVINTGSDKTIMTKLVFGYPFLAYGNKFYFLNDEFYSGELLTGVEPMVMFGGRVELRSQSQDVMRYWANFVKFGNTSSGVKVDLFWPEYGYYNRALLKIDNTNVVKIDRSFRNERSYEYFNNFFYQSLKCISQAEAAKKDIEQQPDMTTTEVMTTEAILDQATNITTTSSKSINSTSTDAESNNVTTDPTSINITATNTFDNSTLFL